MPQPLSVLVLDGNTRAALAVVRSLGKAGYEVTVAAAASSALAARSKYCRKYLAAPEIDSAPQKFSEWLLNTLRSQNFSFLLPVSDASLKLTLQSETEIRKLTLLPTPDLSTYEEVSDKRRLLERAKSLGVSVPETLIIPATMERDRADVEAIRRFPFPAVLKPASSISLLDSHFVRGHVFYPKNADEVLQLISGVTPLGNGRIPYLLQEYIGGVGVGVFGLCRDGELRATFSHQRILEKPPSGGRSVLSESIPLSAAPLDDAAKLLRSYRWNGVAMVEFKLDGHGKPRLMEINPRFWGSLQLAIDAGRDFPKLLLESFTDGTTATQLPDYQLQRRLRWELGCLDHLLIRAKEDPLQALKDIILRNSLQILKYPRATSWEVFRRDDPQPFLAELKQYAEDLFAGSKRRAAAPEDETAGW